VNKLKKISLSIEDLRKICQTKGVKEHWYTRILTRKISIYVTYLFLGTNITSNQVTLLAIFFVLITSILFSFGNYFYSIIGALLLQLYVLFDCVDGEIARYKIFIDENSRRTNVIGKFMEVIEHLITIPSILISISYATYKFYGIIWIIYGFLGVYFFMFLHSIMFWLEKYSYLTVNSNKLANKGLITSFVISLYANEKLKEVILNIFATSTLPFISIILAFLNKIHIILIIYGVILPPGILIFTIINYLNLSKNS